MSDSRLVYICDWLPPDFGAVGQYSVLFARDLARDRGLHVTLVGLTSGEATHSVERFERGELEVVKVPVPAYDKARTSARIRWTITTNTKLLRAALPYIRKAQSVLFTGSPPLFLHWIAPLNVLLRKRLIYRITDFHPECAIAERGSASLFLRLVLTLTLLWRRRVHTFEVLGHDQAIRLNEIGVTKDRIVLKRDPSPIEIGPDTPPLARPPQTEGKFLLLYSGNWGIAHDTTTFVDAYVEHHKSGSGTVLLWLNAIGKGAATVAEALDEARVPYIRTDLVPLDQLASLLRTPDAHLITLKNAFVGYVLPSKVYACVDSDLPVIFIGPTDSDVHLLCDKRKSSSYFHVDVGDTNRCVRLLEDLGTKQSASSAKKIRLVRSSV
ncbi:hypothetical protein [Bradyrhizobium neotropicale]|uniref:Glycosyltransferase subfamily 4-like N-terminal domain-containing protein n=1 Tax=Bradyrhizobium neotropicale TaxID=1497615 RepID=A0A176YN42_9BRAD|nr:hypothetical protein [Bradyrhizobium neotropicale]OAF07450.1 hypothetical protein AXW67_29960 [Bradyrhizobium neotropicale]